MLRGPRACVVLACGALGACSDASSPPPSEAHDAATAIPIESGAHDAGSPPPRILAAFFGLDDALPAAVTLLCPGGQGLDGMPVVFSRRVLGAPAKSAFRVTTRSGAQRQPICATLAPAVGATERHTVLLVGEFGGEPDDPPVRVDIIESLPLEGADDARGLSSDVVPLAAGPSLVLAMRYRPSELPGSACPAETRQIVQITWNGGVSAPGGGAVGDTQRARMHVAVASDAASAELVPDALADLGDNDNYQHLCLSIEDAPLAVRVEAGTFVDPRGDPNAETRVEVTDTR